MLFETLLKRGLISGIYPESTLYREKLKDLLKKGNATVYTGIDATADSLHVGNLATIISSIYLYNHGHQVIYVIGDATARVGDPSGHTRDREQIAKSVIESNATSIEKCICRIFENFKHNFLSSPKNSTLSIKRIDYQHLRRPIILRNSDWYKDRNIVEFVDEIFRDVRVGRLLHKRSIQERLETKEGMNMAEFSYQIFQAYDWLQLKQLYNCNIQIGGNDQQGNIYTGYELIKKRLGDTDNIGMLAPLITDSTGKKLGKTSQKSNSGIWLDPSKSSPYDLYQFFHRTPDDNVEKLLKVFSFYESDYISDIIKTKLKNKSDIWYCQRKLAEHACLLVHGDDGLRDAKRITDSLFPNKTKTN